LEPVTVIVCAPAAADDPTVKVIVAVVPGVMDAGLILAVMPDGTFAVSVTAFLAEPLSVAPTVNMTVLPTNTVPDADDWVREKLAPDAGLVPEPQLLTSSAPSTDPRPVARL
jgi:hypothetical protein